MGLDCRDYLDVKEYEFLFNWYLARLRAESKDIPHQELSYDGFSEYDQWFHRLSVAAQIAFTEKFGYPAPAIVFTNLFHLAELELAGIRNKPKPPAQLM